MPRGQEKDPKQRDQNQDQDPNAGRNRDQQGKPEQGGPGQHTQAFHADEQTHDPAEQE